MDWKTEKKVVGCPIIPVRKGVDLVAMEAWGQAAVGEDLETQFSSLLEVVMD